MPFQIMALVIGLAVLASIVGLITVPDREQIILIGVAILVVDAFRRLGKE